ncbi:MAG: ATP-binding protein [Muribaculaceae bacterium]|nr:ATP-binding protein [Muribaculaceae bacterium]
MVTAEEIKNLLKLGDGLHLEAKTCRDKLPKDVRETYSAFANTRGGVILLGVTEHKDRPLDDRFEFSGVSDYYKIITDFFNIVNNRQKVSRSVLIDSDVRPVKIDGVTIVLSKCRKPTTVRNRSISTMTCSPVLTRDCMKEIGT